jgi:hypothetical protein
MREYVIEISTKVFRVLQRQAPGYVACSEEKPGPSQKILLGEDVYTEFIDRAIAHRQTLDQVVLAACTRAMSQVHPEGGLGGKAKRVRKTN